MSLQSTSLYEANEEISSISFYMGSCFRYREKMKSLDLFNSVTVILPIPMITVLPLKLISLGIFLKIFQKYSVLSR